MNWHEYPILRLVVPLLLGILYYIFFPAGALPIISNFILLLFIAFLAWPRKYLFPYKHRYISGIALYLAFFVAGISLTQYHYSFSNKGYFANQLTKSNYVEVQIVELPEEKPNSIKLIVEVEKVGDAQHHLMTHGLAVVYLQKDSLARSLDYGDILLFKSVLKPIKSPQNPDEFDYKQYLSNNGILYQAYLRSGEWQIIARNEGDFLKSWAFSMRKYLLNELQRHHIVNAEFSVTAAMLLGVRNYLSPELRQAFAGAGAMHILCVSGLHVGIIFMILNAFLTFFDHLKKGRLMRTIIILSSIWIYAMITGFSPSVVRAATMFSFISIGQNIGRHVNIYNSLAASAFILLLFNPYLILDVGFQLSYAAVIAIVALQKPIQNLWAPRSLFLLKIWQLTTVSIAAQIGTAPLALYYFHSFPNYFLLTNLVVIPAAFIIFITGIMVLVFSWAGVLADYFAFLLSKMVYLLNAFIVGIQQLPYAVSRDIYISSWQLAILILLSVFLSVMLIHRKRKLIYVNLSLIILFLVLDVFQRAPKNQFIVYQTGKYDYISYISDHQEFAFTEKDVIEYPDLLDYQVHEHNIRSYIRQRILRDLNNDEPITTANLKRLKQFVGFDSLIMAIISPENAHLNYDNSIDIDYLIITGNPDLDMTQLLDNYHCKLVIIAPSNSNLNNNKWQEVMRKRKVPFYIVKEQGAFVVNL